MTLIRQYRFDCVVISLAAVDLDGTLLDFDLPEVQVAQAMMENAGRLFLPQIIQNLVTTVWFGWGTWPMSIQL